MHAAHAGWEGIAGPTTTVVGGWVCGGVYCASSLLCKEPAGGVVVLDGGEWWPGAAQLSAQLVVSLCVHSMQ